MSTSFRAFQYRQDNELQVGLMVGEADESSPYAQRIPVQGGLTGAIGDARRTGVSLHQHLMILSEQGGEQIQIDLEAGWVRCNGERMALAVPVLAPEIWGAGVTYVNSRAARMEESDRLAAELYERVYAADRPELFLKDAECRRTVPTGAVIGVRGDSTWSVPEPELGLVLAADGEIVGFTIGNDVSARDIEGTNPLYLPQAKIFAAACAIGPVVLVCGPGEGKRSFELTLRIFDGRGTEVFTDSISTSRMNRTYEDLVSYVRKYNVLLDGTVLLTGTGIVPPDDVALSEGYRVEVDVPGLGRLVNEVHRIAE